MIERGEIAICIPFLLKAGWSARNAADHEELLAACAHVHAAGVLHYDRDYDHLVELTSLNFASEWLAAPGTL